MTINKTTVASIIADMRKWISDGRNCISCEIVNQLERVYEHEIKSLLTMKRDYLNMQGNMKRLREEVTLKQRQMIEQGQEYRAKIDEQNKVIQKMMEVLGHTDADFDEFAWMADQLDEEQMTCVENVCSAVRKMKEIINGK